MVTRDEIEARRALTDSGDLAALRDRLIERAEPVMRRMPVVPTVKALLSSDGGTCPACHGQLEFDPWQPERHRCPACDTAHTGPRHHQHWARAQHLWLAERAMHLAALAAITEEDRYADRAREILAAYTERYFELPNNDNVLGPSRLFFSTYLESIWILNLLGAAFLLREQGRLDDGEIEALNQVADEAARLIGEFNEGFSNRQVWNSAALAAIAVWFGDEELAQASMAGPTGLLGLLMDGFGDDGMWREGENYHLFAIRGLLIGLEWARAAGVELLADEHVVETLGRVLMAPAATALPDLTFPARKDSRFGVSLAHPAYLECWEIGLARLADAAPETLGPWLEALYQRPAAVAQTYDAYLHDAGEPARDRITRADLSAWMLLAMEPALPVSEEPYLAESVRLAGQGVAVLRDHHRYLALECGDYGGGHGHPDRLHLTLHADGVHWLADPGTGSYVSRDLFWYRSTLAHNAPRIGGASQPPEAARCLAFDEQEGWGWIAARFRSIERTVVNGPDWMLDVLRPDPDTGGIVELPWHLDGAVTVETSGTWNPTELVADDQVEDAEAFTPAGGGDVVLTATVGDRTLRVHLVGGTVIRATGPGRPGTPRRVFHLVRAAADGGRLVAVLDPGGQVRSVLVGADRIEVASEGGVTTSVRFASAAATVSTPAGQISLGGAVSAPPAPKTLMAERPIRTEGQALGVDAAPALDGTFDGFDCSAALEMSDEGHYYRSEEPWQSPDDFSAQAFVNWDADHLYLAVDVVKPDFLPRPAGAAPLALDNDPDDIHSDGIQVYYRVGDVGEIRAWLIRPTLDGGILARPVPGTADTTVPLTGASARTGQGYRLTVALPCPHLAEAGRSPDLHFDLCVNEMRPGRVRRAGQMAWGGGNGWVYLRSDRRDERAWGMLELIG